MTKYAHRSSPDAIWPTDLCSTCFANLCALRVLHTKPVQPVQQAMSSAERTEHVKDIDGGISVCPGTPAGCTVPCTTTKRFDRVTAYTLTPQTAAASKQDVAGTLRAHVKPLKTHVQPWWTPGYKQRLHVHALLVCARLGHVAALHSPHSKLWPPPSVEKIFVT